MKRFVRIHPSQLLISICKTQLITRSKPVNFIEPKTGEQIWHWGVCPNDERTFRYICQKKKIYIGSHSVAVHLINNFGELAERKSLREHTAWEKLVWIWCIKSFQSISPVKCKLLIYNRMIVLVQSLVLCYLFPHTMPIIVIGYCKFITFSPQEVLQDKIRIKLKT